MAILFVVIEFLGGAVLLVAGDPALLTLSEASPWKVFHLRQSLFTIQLRRYRQKRKDCLFHDAYRGLLAEESLPRLKSFFVSSLCFDVRW